MSQTNTRSGLRPKQQLYQVNVEVNGKLMPVGPAMSEGICRQFASNIDEQIRLGREKRWSNPQVVPLIHLEN